VHQASARRVIVISREGDLAQACWSPSGSTRRTPRSALTRSILIKLDARSGVAPYWQVIHQVRHALRLGLLREGDQLSKVKDVVARLAINPNTRRSRRR
jgi:hypothetical protein